MSLYGITVQDVIRKNALYHADRVAFVCGDERITYGAFALDVMRLAAGLKRLGVEKGDRIAILALNCHEYFLVCGAAAVLGAVVLPINWRLQQEEMRIIMEDCTPCILIAGEEYLDTAKDLLGSTPFVSHTLMMGDGMGGFPSVSETAVDAEPFEEAPVVQDDPFLIVHTAAVEGRPRGAVLSHGNVMAANLQAIVRLGLQSDSVYLSTLPLFHIAGLGFAFYVMQAGGLNVIMRKFDAREALDWIEAERVTFIGTFPPMLSTLMDKAEDSGRSLSNIRVAAGLESPDTIERFERMAQARYITGYGQTETTGLCTFLLFDEKPGSAGKEGPLVRVRVVDEFDRQVPPDGIGEIVVQGPTVFKGYWNLERETDLVFRGGWHHTGDMGRLDDQGYLWYVKRKPEKELIKPGGENVYPLEVEKTLLDHPEVVEACVFGVPDREWGEAVKAVCVRKKDSPLEPAALIEFVASRIARYKKPKYLTFVDVLPKDEHGLVDREKVKGQHGLPG